MLSNLGIDPTPLLTKLPAGGRSKALIFLVDAKYLGLMKVFCYSLARMGTLNNLPVIVLSENPDLLNDPFLIRVADRREAIPPSLLLRLEEAAGRAYKREGKEAWTRATFFKWAVFRDWGVDEALFLDCDMLALRDFSDIFELSDAEIVGAPQFQNGLYKSEEGERRSFQDMTMRIQKFVEDLEGSKISLNSGVMLMRRSVLSEYFLEELLAYTELNKAVNEQQFIAKFMTDRRPGKLEYISPAYNFQHSFLVRLPIYEQAHFLGNARIIHYAGQSKPWERPPSRPNLGSVLWNSTVEEAAKFYATRGLSFVAPGSGQK